MARNKLIPYHLKVRELRQKVDYTDLLNPLRTGAIEDYYVEDPQEAPADFIEMFQRYCEEWMDEAYLDQDLQKSFRISGEDGEFEVDRENNLVEGEIKVGEYGQNIDSYDTEEGTSTTSVIEPDEAAETPLYFLLHIPEENPEEAIVVLEQSNNRGAKTQFQNALQNKLLEGITQEMERIADDEVYQIIRDADRVAKFHVEKTESPDSLGGEFGDVFSPSSTAKRITYTPTGSGGIRMDIDELENWMESSDNPFSNINGDTYTEFKVTVENAGSQTTIDFFEQKVDKSRILDSVEMEGGHPVPSYMSTAARRFTNQELLPAGADRIPTTSLLR